MRAEFVEVAGPRDRFFGFLKLFFDIELVVFHFEVVEDVGQVRIVKAADKKCLDVEVIRECLPVPVTVDAVAGEKVLVVLLSGELAVRDSHGDRVMLAAEKLQDHEALMARNDLVVEVDHGKLDEVEFLERALQVLRLFRTHRPRIFNVGHQVGDFALDGAPGELCTHIYLLLMNKGQPRRCDWPLLRVPETKRHRQRWRLRAPFACL